jgi:hypothetical protein
MIQICAWCKTQIADLGGDPEEVSDGICKDCLGKYFPERGKSVREQAQALVDQDAPQRARSRG